MAIFLHLRSSQLKLFWLSRYGSKLQTKFKKNYLDLSIELESSETDPIIFTLVSCNFAKMVPKSSIGQEQQFFLTFSNGLALRTCLCKVKTLDFKESSSDVR